MIVGGQSSGKSSLLQSLTDIPFPTGQRCCTRYPIRVVSRRSTPGTEDHFQITVEAPENQVPSPLPLANMVARKYKLSGKTLTMEKFQEALEDVSNPFPSTK